jgi:hypothetical protein
MRGSDPCFAVKTRELSRLFTSQLAPYFPDVIDRSVVDVSKEIGKVIDVNDLFW